MAVDRACLYPYLRKVCLILDEQIFDCGVRQALLSQT